MHFSKADDWSISHISSLLTRFLLTTSSALSIHVCISLVLFMLCFVFNTRSRLQGIKPSKLPFPSNLSHFCFRIYGRVLTSGTEAQRNRAKTPSYWLYHLSPRMRCTPQVMPLTVWNPSVSHLRPFSSLHPHRRPARYSHYKTCYPMTKAAPLLCVSPWNRTAARESSLSLAVPAEARGGCAVLAAMNAAALWPAHLAAACSVNQNQKMLEGWTALCRDHMLVGLLKVQ